MNIYQYIRSKTLQYMYRIKISLIKKSREETEDEFYYRNLLEKDILNQRLPNGDILWR